MYDAGVALNGLSCFVTPDLARDLANDVTNLLVATRPYVRKRGILLLFKIFLKFPEALRPSFPRLKDKLEDDEPGVQSAAVNVICELARKNPKNYLSLAPVFFKLMNSSTNNWTLIKIIKLFGALCPLEPRLGKKMIEPLTNLIHTTSAMSLLYECVNTMIAGVPNHNSSMQLCVQKLRIFIEDCDQNLKYLGLLAMSKILKVHPKAVMPLKDIILQCLDDKDEFIRRRALDLIVGMVNKKNLMDIVKKLTHQAEKCDSSGYRDELISKIIMVCSQSDYHHITNFEWYIDVLIQLTKIEGTRHGKLIAAQMLDVPIRVKAVRSYAVQCLSFLLDSSDLLSGSIQKHGMCEVLFAAAWICGEFAHFLSDQKVVLMFMLKSRVSSLPGHIQSVYVQNILKLYSYIMAKAEEKGDMDEAQDLGQLIVDKLPMFTQSSDLEVQERACVGLQLIKYVLKLQAKGFQCSAEVSLLFTGELNPVATKAQKKVPIPEGLDLDKWINDPPESSDEEEDDEDINNMFFENDRSEKPYQKKESKIDEKELEKLREKRREEQMHNPHYLKGSTSSKAKSSTQIKIEDIPVSALEIPISLHIEGSGVSKSRKSKNKKKRGKKGRKGDSDSEEDHRPIYEVLKTVEGEMPENARASDDEVEEKTDVNDPHSLLNVDLDKPLDDNEKLPVRTHRVTSPQAEKTEEVEEEKKKEKRKKKEKHHSKKSHKEGKRHRHGKSKHDKEKKKQTEDIQENSGELVLDATTETAVCEPAEADVKDVEGKKSPDINDIDYWLNTPESKPATATLTATEKVSEAPQDSQQQQGNVENLKSSKSKKSKSEKKTKEKKHKRDKKKTREEPVVDVSQTDVATEENSMIHLVDVEPEPEETTKYKLLAEDKNIQLMYDIKPNPQVTGQIVAMIIFSNRTQMQIKNLEMNIMDTLNTKLIRPMNHTSHDAVKVPFQLPAGASNEGQFAFASEKIGFPQKLRSTLTYMIQYDDGSTSEKLDFKLPLPCSSYIVPTACSSDNFAALLSSGDLSEKISTEETISAEVGFTVIISKICYSLHLSVVERVDNSASLFGRSILQDNLCFLVKKNETTVTVDAKSSDNSLLLNIFEEVKSLLKDLR
ncbi:AP-3 complex subunit delta-1-like isoform X1 [Xenia sp. Carnegie-2017]|nr:AP-3 complex subunit delta-1-like isoform X1 [Xenia sp. Carnegie-2017]